jgi:hypothetical protein
MTPPQATAVHGPRRWKRPTVVLVASLLAVLVVLASRAPTVVRGAQAYLFAYPLVVSEVTRVHALQTLGPENQLLRVRQFPDAQFRGVVRPNLDTLYTTAFLDMEAGPWVFEMPANNQRYELMPFMDAWTHVFASPGTRTTGTAGGRFLLAGPRWSGPVPEGLTLLRAPTRRVWLIGRTQTNGAQDYPLVHRLQDGLQLRTLADWQAGRTPVAAPWARAGTPPAEAPVYQMQTMDVQTLFTHFARLLPDNPPHPEDGPMLDTLAQLGIAPGRPPDWGWLDRQAVALGRWIADHRVARELGRRPTVRGWITPPAEIGAFGTQYNLRAVVAMIGLGANLPADASYPAASVDSEGGALNGRHRYRLHFAAKDLPPVRAFWSVTAYGSDDFLIPHPSGRHKLGSQEPLQFNADGSLDLWIQAEPPAPAQRANWLPVQHGEPFLLNARLYGPLPQALDGRWGMPGIERLD